MYESLYSFQVQVSCFSAAVGVVIETTNRQDFVAQLSSIVVAACALCHPLAPVSG